MTFVRSSQAARQVRVRVGKHSVHHMAEPRIGEDLTFANLHAAIDSISDIFRKYAGPAHRCAVDAT